MKELPDGESVDDSSAAYVDFRSYKALVARHKRAEKLRRYFRFTALTVLAAVGSFGLVWGMMMLKPWATLSSRPWSATMQASHIAAYPSCDAARAVGLAPSYKGQPGYWPQHDRDNDGVACEPWPR
jgi:hypothetical protein